MGLGTEAKGGLAGLVGLSRGRVNCPAGRRGALQAAARSLMAEPWAVAVGNSPRHLEQREPTWAASYANAPSVISSTCAAARHRHAPGALSLA